MTSSSSSPQRSGPAWGSSLVSHCGRVVFDNGNYSRAAGTDNWNVQAIPGFGLEIGPPLGQIRIVFAEPVTGPYVVLISPSRSTSAPHLAANYGDVGEGGFVVHTFDPSGTRTLQNGGFSFAVLVAGDGG